MKKRWKRPREQPDRTAADAPIELQPYQQKCTPRVAANWDAQFLRLAPLYHRGAQGRYCDRLRYRPRNLRAQQGQAAVFVILNILVLISTISIGLHPRLMAVAFEGTSFAPETETSQKHDPEVALGAAPCPAAASKSPASRERTQIWILDRLYKTSLSVRNRHRFLPRQHSGYTCTLLGTQILV